MTNSNKLDFIGNNSLFSPQFSNARTNILQISKLTRKERKIGNERKIKPPKETQAHILRLVLELIVPLPEALGRLQLPLPRRSLPPLYPCVAISGARGSGRGGGWENEEREL